ncbi:BlaR1 peptidase M56 family protein, partial [Zunongwangia atlantica 22II14-10F7]
MLDYVLKFSGCLVVLYSFYRVFLENEKNHGFKRFYLLFTLVGAIVLPLITISYSVEVNAIANANTESAVPAIIDNPETMYLEITEDNVSFFEAYYPAMLWIIYVAGFVVFAIRFSKNTWRLNKLILKNEKIWGNHSIKVLLPFSLIPYSYFNYIFVEKEA